MIYVYAALLTAFIETAFFWCCSYRSKAFLVYVFFINLLSNTIVNQVFVHTYALFPYNIYLLIFLLEMGVLIFEYLLLLIYLRRSYTKLFVLLFIANLITWSLGEILSRLLF